ncbi:MAG: hypothetical protein H0W61_03080 [Bacteroidetes bacterium]|nr:hypothetical protein [Bacteroidota bacterium]
MLGQLGFYAAKTTMKRAKINASVRKHKREVNRNVRRARKGHQPPYDLIKEKKDVDSLTYLGGFSGICKELKLVFTSLKQDTVIANYRFEEKDLSVDEKQVIKELVEKAGPDQFTNVIIYNCHRRSVLSETEASWMDERVRKIRKYLKTLGIKENKVVVEE